MTEDDRPHTDGARFRDVLAEPQFRALWVAQLLSVLGDQVARVALAVLVFTETASAGLTALSYALTFLPDLVAGPLLSGVADRAPRRTTVVVSDVLSPRRPAGRARGGAGRTEYQPVTRFGEVARQCQFESRCQFESA